MKRITSFCLLLLMAGVFSQAACVNARAPDVYINTGPSPEDVDSSKVPPTTTHAEARAELELAYRQIRYLESENRRLEERADKYKSKYKSLKDKYDD